MRTQVLAASLLFLFNAAACEVVGDDADLDDIEATVTSTVVARVTTSDGAVWRFLEGEPGDLLLWGIAPDTSRTDYSSLAADRLSYVEMYQQLTSQPVPRSLLDAQARADALLDEEDPYPGDDGGLVNEAGGTATSTGTLTQAISSADFQNQRCPNNWDYLYCWPSFYGSPYVQRKGDLMAGYVAAVNNTVDFRLRYKKHSYSGWTTSISAQALPGQLHHVLGHYWAYRRWRRFEVLDNGSNLVRYSSYGSDD